MLYNLKALLELLDKLRQYKTPVTIAELSNHNADCCQNLMLLRCDVERNLKHTLNFAQEITKIGLSCTFYFHTRLNCYDPVIFSQISNLGHEIGYHYECLDRCKGDAEKARKLFLREIEQFRRDGFDIHTTCPHGESGLRKSGYNSNSYIFEAYPDLLNLAQVKDIYKTVLKERDFVFASDIFTKYRKFRPTIERHFENPKLLLIILHPHRWHNSKARVLWEVTRDISRRYMNKYVRSRRYKTIWRQETFDG